MGFAALTAFGGTMTLQSPPYVLTNWDASAYYFQVITPNVTAWGSGSCTNVPFDMTNIVSVSAGYDDVLAMRADGTLTGWGSTTYGELGIPDGARTNSVAYSAGRWIGASILGDGTGVMWGNGTGGTPVYFGSGLMSIFCNGSNEVLTTTSTGDAVSYVLGTGTSLGYNNAVSFIGNAAGRYMVLFSDGTVTNWGGTATLSPSISGAVAIAQGSATNLALMADYSVWRWNPATGAAFHDTTTNYSEVMAYGTTIYQLRTNGTVLKAAGLAIPAGITNAIAIGAGSGYGLAVTP